MAHVMFTFLGGGSRRSDIVDPHNDPRGGYQKATYVFPDGDRQTTSLFGLALLAHLRDVNDAPGRVVIFGTSGSFWENLASLLLPTDGYATERDALYRRQSTNEVGFDDLQPLVGPISKAILDRFGVAEALIRLIPYCGEAGEQLDFLKNIADSAGKGDHVTFDVTHGFRHFPLLGVFAAMAVRKLKRVSIDGIWYGAYEHPANSRDAADGAAPALRLDGLLAIVDWLEALTAFDADGDYSRFAELVKRDGMMTAGAARLSHAAFRERISDLASAARYLREFRKDLLASRVLGASALFAPELDKRVMWSETGDAYSHYRSLAIEALARNDFVKAAMFGFEAAVTRIAEHFGDGDPLNRFVREDSKDSFFDARENRRRKRRRGSKEAFAHLAALRNRLIHGAYTVETPEDSRTELNNALQSEEALRRFMDELFRQLLPEDDTQPFPDIVGEDFGFGAAWPRGRGHDQ